ncbi:SMI1/KNR4 family protein (plasmid) [Agrobacterium sp. rho-13.3]|uniref:SMI1/KNR4 family protein n=1 Tax=Agrobacterium sp. rho-13.3 TaxID=3072980 RepID=UPI0039B754B5
MAFPVDETQIAAAEGEIGYLLPLQLRARLLRSNGGLVQSGEAGWWLFPVFDPTDRKRIGRTANHIARETASWRLMEVPYRGHRYC